MSDWIKELKEAVYTPPGSGPVVDSYKAESVVLKAYAMGIEKGMEMLVNHISKEMNSDLPTLLPLDLPQRLQEHLDEIYNEVKYGKGPTTPDAPTSEEGG